MVQETQQQKPQPQPNKPGPGAKPTGPRLSHEQATAKRRQSRLDGLQRSLDMACSRIHDSSASYAFRAVRAAKEGIPRETVEAGLNAIRAAVEDLTRAVDVAYSQAKKTEKKQSRVRLA